MKRRIVFISLIIILIVTISLYYTYAINIDMSESSGTADLTYNININDISGTSITVNAGKTNIFDFVLKNNNGATISYALAYSGTKPNTVTIAKLNTSSDPVTGTIANNTTKRITLVIDNKSSTNYTYTIIPVKGYVNGGTITAPSGYTLITGIYDYSNVANGSDANPPMLVQGLIPVMYNGSNWVKADSTNENETYKWYDYNNKQWANAVLVSSTNRSTYQNASAGTVIPESNVLAYYVWIPRYKYKVWNINKVMGTDSYNAQTTGVDIVFETGTAKTGTINCSYSFSVTATDSVRNETCTGSNGDYYTHPAFWWDMDGDSVHDTGEELEGIWVGKFEISSETPDAVKRGGGIIKGVKDDSIDKTLSIEFLDNTSRSKYENNVILLGTREPLASGNYYFGGGDSTSLTVRIKPNVRIWRYNELTNYYKVIYDMQKSSNIYGLSTDRTNTDSHMMKNMEWGAVAYLTNSKYGRCSNNTCSEVTANSNGDLNNGIYAGGNNYIANVNQSTTGNVYGIYDMSGGGIEYLMSNKSSSSGSYTYYANSGGSNFSYSSSTARYIDRYAYGTTLYDQTSYNRSKLGDAIGEVAVSSSVGWYSDTLYFDNTWLTRGGRFNNTNIGIFFSVGDTGDSNYYYSAARAILLGLSN